MPAPTDADLGYRINDADNHFNEPPDCFERYIDPSKAELAIRHVTGPDGRRMQLFAGRPSKFTAGQVTYSQEELQKMLGDTSNIGAGRSAAKGADGEAATDQITMGVVPGMLLNRLNPLKDLN